MHTCIGRIHKYSQHPHPAGMVGSGKWLLEMLGDMCDINMRYNN